MRYVYEWAMPRIKWLINRAIPERRHTSIVLTTRQIATINAMAARATQPDYVVITRDKKDHTFRFVSFIKDVDNKSYQSNTLAVRVDGWSPDLPQAKEEPDETTS